MYSEEGRVREMFSPQSFPLKILKFLYGDQCFNKMNTRSTADQEMWIPWEKKYKPLNRMTDVPET